MPASRLRWVLPLISIALLAGALWILHHELVLHPPREIARAIHELPRSPILLAFALTVAAYAFLPVYDAIGLRYVGRPLGLGRTMFAGFLAYGFSQTLGFSWLTGGSLRYRLYSAWGLSASEIAGVIGAASVTFWLGASSIAGVALLGSPAAAVTATGLMVHTARMAGMMLLLLPASYLVFAAMRRRPLMVFGWEVQPPRFTLSLWQVAAGCGDWALAASVAYLLLPAGTGVPFLPFIGIFVLAQVLGVISHLPGGLGVFESTVVLLLKDQVPSSAILGSLLVYRVVYYVVPFCTAVATLAVYEIRERRAAVSRAARAARTAVAWLPGMVPRIAAAGALAAGTVLLYSGALPAEGARMAWLSDFVPLSVIEVSHFLGSLAGAGLLILAWGLARRLDGAFHLAVMLLGVGMAASLLKGADYEEAVITGIVLLALLSARPHFDRRASLLHEPLSAPWVVAIGAILVSAVWLGLIVHRHIPYRDDLWWRFALKGDAPRFMRATVGTLVAAAVFGLARLFRPARAEPARPTEAELARLAPIVAASPRTYPNLVLLGDKSVLVNDAGTAFLMYAVSGHSWIVMGDPVGEPSAHPDLVWQFREIVDQHGGYTVFYEVTPQALPLYLDLGLRPLKLGEEGLVRLEGFTLEGGSRRSMRRVRRELEKEGCSFAILSPAEAEPVIGQLREISDAWLAEKQTREKGFSLGRFDPAYIRRFPVAVVRRAGRLVAFASVWMSGGKAELSPDLMRYRPDAPKGVMEYLFIEMMLWGAAQGYQWFNLGMAPLSGIEQRALAPLWNRFSALVYLHGEHFYNFQGLRQYKEKFDPEWSPRYLVSPGGLALPRVLADVASLISGGLAGVLTK